MREHSQAPRVALVADTDSRWKWANATAAKLGDVRLQHFLIEGPARPNERQLREAGVDPADVVPVSIEQLPRALARRECDVAIVALPGGACQAVLHAFVADPVENRPVLITGYVGVVYEKILEGLLLRGGSDIVLANSPHDARLFRGHFSDYGVDPDSVVESPLPYLSGHHTVTPHERFTVTFAAQPSVPTTQHERHYVVERLVAHARLHPERDVILKLRSLPGERVTHPDPFPYPKIVEKLGELPPNFSMVGGPMSTVLARTDLMLTVSSTAAVEAIQAHLPTGILTDFGINDRIGTPFYASSGCFTSFDAIDAGGMPTADAAWALDNGLHKVDHTALRQRVDDLLAQRPLAQVTPFFTTGNASYYLPRLLWSYGLGEPVDTGTALARFPRLQRFVRSMSKSAYRIGINTVVPALRKLGSL